jgi:hypothetical protein
MAKLGVQSELKVTFHPAHEVYFPQAVTITASLAWLPGGSPSVVAPGQQR